MPKGSVIQDRRVSQELPLDSDPDPKPMANSQFSRFGELPPETRLQIWRTAVHQATVNRTIHVEVHPQLQATAHDCFTSSGVFCGNHGSCPTFREGVPHWSADCMSDGYFASTSLVSSPEDSESSCALASLSLACRESRMIVLELYPKVLKVYQGPWHPGAESRQVRCCPETDVLVIYEVPDMSLAHQHFASLLTEEHWLMLQESQMKKFPYNRRQFAGFREIISCFQHVAIFSRLGLADKRSQQALGLYLEADEYPPVDLLDSTDMMALLLFFTSLKHLYVWLDPATYPNAWDNAIRVSNVEDLKADEEGNVDHLQGSSVDFLDSYNEQVEVHNNHFATDDTHWVPKPKLLERVGCYCPASWLR